MKLVPPKARKGVSFGGCQTQREPAEATSQQWAGVQWRGCPGLFTITGLLPGEGYFEGNDFQLDCGFGGGAKAGVCGVGGKKINFPRRHSCVLSATFSPGRTSRSQLCPGRMSPGYPPCVPFYPVSPTPMIHKNGALESTIPPTWPVASWGQGGEVGPLQTQTGC